MGQEDIQKESAFHRSPEADKVILEWSVLRDSLPVPIYEKAPIFEEAYWKAWKIAAQNFYRSTSQNGFISPFIDAAFNDSIFLWDTSFLTMFCNIAYPLAPGIVSLDNFYINQHPDGEISREIVRASGEDYRQWVNWEDTTLFSRVGWNIAKKSGPKKGNVNYRDRTPPKPNPDLTLDGLNHPILSWAEIESYRYTGNKQGLRRVWKPLVRYYLALQKYLRQGNGLYTTDWASMDNSPRNPYLKNGGTGIDISSEMVLFARCLSKIAHILGYQLEAQKYQHEANQLARIINKKMWDEDQQFYFDLTLHGDRSPIKTIAAFWTLIAQVASPTQAKALVRQLNNSKTFKRAHRVPTLAADEPSYNPGGGYWQGSVWAPTNTMVIRGLQKYGYHDLVDILAKNDLDAVMHIYKKTKTFWENYSSDFIRPGDPAKQDFVGWSGIEPILYFFEFGIGIRPNASQNELVWHVNTDFRSGVKKYRFNRHIITLIAEPSSQNKHKMRINVKSNGKFTLILKSDKNSKTVTVYPGKEAYVFAP